MIQYGCNTDLCHCLSFVTGSVNDEYKRYPNKRLMNNVIKTVVMSSKFDCVTLCSMTDSCLAVNVMGNYDITCELTTGLSNENEMEDDSLSELFVLGKGNIARYELIHIAM